MSSHNVALDTVGINDLINSLQVYINAAIVNPIVQILVGGN